MEMVGVVWVVKERGRVKKKRKGGGRLGGKEENQHGSMFDEEVILCSAQPKTRSIEK